MYEETYVISKNIQIPEATAGRGRSKAVETIKKCGAGDSFVVYKAHEKNLVQKRAYRNNVKVTTRTVESGKCWRIWRLSENAEIQRREAQIKGVL